jgi:VanZ family protein
MVLACWLVFLLVLSFLPVKGPETDLPADKVGHFIAYGITAVLFCRYFMARVGPARAVVFSVVSASCYGALIEIFQGLTPYRQFSFADMAANTAGAVVFGLAYAAWMKK